MSENENHSCNGDCSHCSHKEQENEDCQIKLALSKIKHKIVVLSGKGGVGKSTVSVNLAMALACEGMRVGLLDVDVHGPSIPKMLHLEGRPIMATEEGKWLPHEIGCLKIMSVGFLLESPDTALIWRGPLKISLIRQFLSQVEWGELDYLIIDTPPGTGDEPLTACQSIPDGAGAVIVTTPQAVSATDVVKSISFCQQLDFPILGIIENMSGFACPHCGEVTEIFSSGAGQELADKFGLKLLGKIPIDPAICRCGDDGKPFVHAYGKTATAKAFQEAIQPILDLE